MDNPPDLVFAKIFTGLSVVEEAGLFASLQTDRKLLTPLALFKSSLKAKYTWAVAINHAAEMAGMSIGKSLAKGNVTAVDTCKQIYTRRGEWMLTRILGIVNSAWPDNINPARSTILCGLEYFLLRFPDVDTNQLVKALINTTPKRLDVTAHGYAETLQSSMIPATGYAIYAAYNKGLRTNKLPSWDWE